MVRSLAVDPHERRQEGGEAEGRGRDENVSQCSGTRDLEKFTDSIVKDQMDAKNVPECVEELAGCIFVQNVEAAALAVMTPVLVRGLNERTEAVMRRCCVIVDNM